MRTQSLTGKDVSAVKSAAEAAGPTPASAFDATPYYLKISRSAKLVPLPTV